MQTPAAIARSAAAALADGGASRDRALPPGPITRRFDAILHVIEIVLKDVANADPATRVALTRLTEVLARIVNLPQQPQESLRDFTRRLAAHMDVLPPQARALIEKQLGQQSLLVALKMLVETLRPSLPVDIVIDLPAQGEAEQPVEDDRPAFRQPTIQAPLPVRPLQSHPSTVLTGTVKLQQALELAFSGPAKIEASSAAETPAGPEKAMSAPPPDASAPAMRDEPIPSFREATAFLASDRQALAQAVAIARGQDDAAVLPQISEPSGMREEPQAAALYQAALARAAEPDSMPAQARSLPTQGEAPPPAPALAPVAPRAREPDAALLLSWKEMPAPSSSLDAPAVETMPGKPPLPPSAAPDDSPLSAPEPRLPRFGPGAAPPDDRHLPSPHAVPDPRDRSSDRAFATPPAAGTESGKADSTQRPPSAPPAREPVPQRDTRAMPPLAPMGESATPVPAEIRRGHADVPIRALWGQETRLSLRRQGEHVAGTDVPDPVRAPIRPMTPSPPASPLPTLLPHVGPTLAQEAGRLAPAPRIRPPDEPSSGPPRPVQREPKRLPAHRDRDDLTPASDPRDRRLDPSNMPVNVTLQSRNAMEVVGALSQLDEWETLFYMLSGSLHDAPEAEPPLPHPPENMTEDSARHRTAKAPGPAAPAAEAMFKEETGSEPSEWTFGETRRADGAPAIALPSYRPETIAVREAMAFAFIPYLPAPSAPQTEADDDLREDGEPANRGSGGRDSDDSGGDADGGEARDEEEPATPQTSADSERDTGGDAYALYRQLSGLA